MAYQTNQQDFVSTNRRRFVVQAIVLAPILLVAAVIFAIRLAVGYRTSEGIGSAAVLVTVAALLVPVILWGAHALLWIYNGRIVSQFGRFSVKTWTSRVVGFENPVAIVWKDVVVVYGEGKAVVLDPKQWEPNQFARVIWRLPSEEVVPSRLKGASSSWKSAIKHQTQGRVTKVIGPFRLMHSGIYWTLWTVAVIAAIGFVVNIDKFFEL